MTAAAEHPESLFLGGPGLGLQARLGLAGPGELWIGRRVLVFLLLAWLPLLALTAVEGRLQGSGGLLTDYGAWARYVIAGPLLLAAELGAGRVLSRVAERFASLLPEAGPDRARFARSVDSVRHLRDVHAHAFALVLVAYALSLATEVSTAADQLPAWHRLRAEQGQLSLAGWWVVLVSLPLLLSVLLGWIWRLAIWTRFLLQVAQLDLQLLPVHPDKAGGLGFAGQSLRGFAMVAAGTGVIVAGAVADAVLHGGATLAGMKYTVLATVAGNLLVFTAPLCTFTPKLWHEWQRGVREYDQLARELGREFERDWFRARRPAAGVALLERPDFSAACDLYTVVDRVRQMRWLPVDVSSLAGVAAASLLPFVPVAFLALPLDVVLAALAGLLR